MGLRSACRVSTGGAVSAGGAVGAGVVRASVVRTTIVVVVRILGNILGVAWGWVLGTDFGRIRSGVGRRVRKSTLRRIGRYVPSRTYGGRVGEVMTVSCVVAVVAGHIWLRRDH